MMVQRIRIWLVMVTFVLLTILAIATPRKMSGWDFPRRQTETGKTPILLTTTRYSQVTNLFPWKFVTCTCSTVLVGGRLVGRDDDTSFSSPPASSCCTEIALPLVDFLLKNLVAKRMRERRSRKRRRRRRMECVALWSMGSLNELSSHFLLFLLFEFDDYFSSFLSSCLPSSAQSLDQERREEFSMMSSMKWLIAKDETYQITFMMGARVVSGLGLQDKDKPFSFQVWCENDL